MVKSGMKILLFLLIGMLCFNLVTAAWFFIFQTSVSMKIDSIGSQKDVTLSIPNININTTNSSASGGGMTTFAFNKAGTFNISIIETFGDLSGGQCTNGATDCIISYSLYDGSSTRNITNNQQINITANSNIKQISANLSCVAYSCPQTRDIVIKLNQIS